MKLYHYSAAHFDQLKTLEKQRPLTKEEIEEGARSVKWGAPLPYYSHISFFFEPVPLDILSSIFPKDHHTWFKGSRLYEYIVDPASIDHFQYAVVESPEKTELYYDESLSIEEYHRRNDALKKKFHYTGHSLAELQQAAKHLEGTTRACFLALPSRPNWSERGKDSIQNKYAATVPHVMLYPASGVIEYQSVKKVTVK